MKHWLVKAWYRGSPWLKLLYPLSLVLALVVRTRRGAAVRSRQGSGAKALVVVIGNITAGGTGKTPLTLALAQALQKAGLKAGIVSRGYGGHSNEYPLEVRRNTPHAQCGDEALIYATRAGCPVIVDPQRARAVARLEELYRPDVILSDDGLQHYAMARDVELVVIDGQRGLGNGLLLPAGPLREPPARLDTVDAVVINGPKLASLPQLRAREFAMTMNTGRIHHLGSGEILDCAAFLARFRDAPRIHAVAGTGNPERFFSTLTKAGFAIITHVFADHHRYTAQDLAFSDHLPIVMTEKDAVKCREFANERLWYLCVDAILPEGLLPMLQERLASKRHPARA